MNRILMTVSFGSFCLVFGLGAADAQQREDYCGALKMLLQSAKSGFAQAKDFKMAGANTCGVETDTRSYGCMWSFEQSGRAQAGYQNAIKAASACFPSVSPKQSRSARGTLHTEYDFGKGEPLIDISRGRPGSIEGDWYSIDVVAP